MSPTNNLSENLHCKNSNDFETSNDVKIDLASLESMIKKYEKERSVQKIVTFYIEPALAKGENYASYMSRIRVEALVGSDKRKQIQKKKFITKTVAHDDVTAYIMNGMKVFGTEMDMYVNILPMMNEIVDEFGIVDGKLWADSIGHIEDNLLIFEDLSVLGFSTAKRELGFDELHASITLKGLARFHAISVVLNRRGRLNKNVVFNKKQHFIDVNGYFGDIIKSGFKFIVEVIKEGRWGSEWVPRADRVEQYFGKVSDICKDLYYNRKDPLLNVMCHGDCWVNNMMFKYSDLVPYPIGIRFVDFQFSHFDSFAWDLIYLFYTSFTTELRNEKMDFFLNIYQQALHDNFKLLNLPMDLLPSLKDVKNEMDKLMHFAVIAHSFVFAIISYDGKDDIMEIGRMGIDAEFKNYYTNKKTVKNMKGTFEYFLQKGLF